MSRESRDAKRKRIIGRIEDEGGGRWAGQGRAGQGRAGKDWRDSRIAKIPKQDGR